MQSMQSNSFTYIHIKISVLQFVHKGSIFNIQQHITWISYSRSTLKYMDIGENSK